ncbi:hypothetical protein EW146_g7575 [Bondarzewia mesenterica]|uniref:Aminoglycoside phosphotransferase domain-containing protein n=1 Tax=Bondarzewia mesenterica TaxID=1095465 RepID=A0A4S4LKY4_9AGAM|nr:hypothetical protein EW146_g7575 [Bondarzewia mesenterica]
MGIPSTAQTLGAIDSNDPVFNPTAAMYVIDDILTRLKHAERLQNRGKSIDRRNLFDLGDGRLVKRGYRVSDTEAKPMQRLVRSNTSIPVPEVLLAFKEDNVNYIAMEITDGYALANAVSGNFIADEVLHNIFVRSAAIVAQLRCLGARLDR